MTDDVQKIESEEQADALLEEINEPQKEEATEPGAKPETGAEASNQQASQNIDEFSLNVGGKEIKAKRDQILKWAQMGYDAPNKIGELNNKLATYLKKEQEFKALEEKYGPVDKFVRENPQFWDLVQQKYQETLNQNQANPQLNALLQQQIQPLMQKVDELEKYKNQIVHAQEDKAYQEELNSLKTKYPKIDFHSPDETGKSLEYKVLEYARDNGIRKLTTAFRDFYHDELMNIRETEAKEKLIQDKQSKSKLGILGINTAPTKKVSDNVKGKTYQDLEREALEELGIAR